MPGVVGLGRVRRVGLLVGVVFVVLPVGSALAAGTWTATGSLNTARENFTATLLPDGKVLVAGGSLGTPALALASAELYDPSTGTWTATGSMHTARDQFTATLLADGTVLVAGGYGPGGRLASAELYDPSTGTWTTTGSLNTARELQTATLLADGKVLVVGGADSGGNPLASAELYDPSTEMWTTTGSLDTARWNHTATLLPDAKVLVAGGSPADSPGGTFASAELYDPSTGMWTTTGSMHTAREDFTATWLPDAKVLVAGGADSQGTFASAELYDPSTGTWTATGSLNTARDFHTATLLADGKVLVAGGFGPVGAFASAELYDPSTETWTTTGSLNTGRAIHTATLLADGKVLVAAGQDSSGFLVASAELYTPPDDEPPTLTVNPSTLAAPDSVTVSWSDVSAPSSHDWIGVYHPGDANNAPIAKLYDDSCSPTAGTTALASGSCMFRVPGLANIAGTYELRLFSNDSFTLLATSNLVTVNQGATLTVNPLSLHAGSAVTVSWSAVSAPTSHDWVGAYQPGDPNGTPLSRFYDDSCTRTAGTTALASGSCTFTVPKLSNIAGTYVLRLFSNDSLTLLATSDTVTVGAGSGSAARVEHDARLLPLRGGGGGSLRRASRGSRPFPLRSADW